MNAQTEPLIRPFDQAVEYAQEEPGVAQFNRLIAAGEFPGIVSGRVRLQGPIHKTPAVHDTWDQIYLVLSGSAVLHVGAFSTPVSGPTVVTIPRGTRHSVELTDGESIDYVYINQKFFERTVDDDGDDNGLRKETINRSP